jgi:membrane protein
VPEIPPFLKSIYAKIPILESPIHFVWRFINRWNDDSCALMAAALAFFGLLSVFPLALAGVTILARVLVGNESALRDFSTFIASFFPGAAGENLAREVSRGVQNIATGPSATTASVLAFASLLWSGRAYFDTLATILNKIFPSATPRSFLQHQITLWSLLFGTGLLFVLSTAATFALTLAQSLASRLPNLFINNAPVLWDLLGKGVSYALTLFMFFLLYRYTPNRTQPFKRRIVVLSALVATLGWEIGKWGFARFLGNVTRYEATYGSVAGVILTMLWIYFASTIVLFGAEIGATTEDIRAEKLKGKGLPEEGVAL